MKAVILTVGDELLIGQVLNSNAAWLGEQLNLAGIDVDRAVTVGDDQPTIEREVTTAMATDDLVIITGGLGPTHDDLTREALAATFRAELVFRPEIYEAIRRRFAARGRHMPESNRSQAMVPAGFTVLPNPAGTAPGLWHAALINGKETLLAVLPGVPHEMKILYQKEVLPRLLERKDLRVIEHRTLLTAAIGESHLQEKIGDLSDYLSPQLRLAYLPSTSGVRLRMTAVGQTREEVKALLERFEKRLRDHIESYIYGTGAASLPEVVGKMLDERGLTIAVAESCTGGLVANEITNVSGSSAYMLGGVVAYSNAVKREILGVDEGVLETEGAVSEIVARQLAEGVRRKLGADIGISTTGIAGPTGGTPEKPVGTVWIGYADEEGTDAVLLHLVTERILNKELTSTYILNYVRRRLLGVDGR